jgi:ABC-2 type transport system permease protein
MAELLQRPGAPALLHYRPWQGTFHGPALSVWPIARTSLWMIFRRKLFWGLYALGMMIFLLNFFGLYLLLWLETQTAQTRVRAGILGRVNVSQAIKFLRRTAHLDGSGDTYGNYFYYQGYTVMIVLALTGAILIGNDLRFGSLPFYLSKPLSRWHYLGGKALAVAVFVNLMTTLPALVLFLQYGLFEPLHSPDAGNLPLAILAYALLVTAGLTVLLLARAAWVRHLAVGGMALGTLFALLQWDYVQINGTLLLGILGYGVVLTVSLTIMLLATATWLQRTVPLIMAWTAVFFFSRRLAYALVDRLNFDPHWKLIDLWNNIYLTGMFCLQTPVKGRHPEWYEAALVLGGVCLLCLIYLVRRIRAVEIVR